MRIIRILTFTTASVLALSSCGGTFKRPDSAKQNDAPAQVTKSEQSVRPFQDNQQAPNTTDIAQGGASDVTGDFERSKLIAADFVATLSQIPETSPAAMVLHTDKPTSRFGELLLSSLQGAGYDLRLGDESSNTWLAYSAELDAQPSIDNNSVYTFILAAGEVKLKRSYEVDELGVKPTGNMFVRGASASDLVMDDSRFEAGSQQIQQQVTQPSAIAKSQVQNSASNSLVDESQVTQRIELDTTPATKPFQAKQKLSSEFSVNETWGEIRNMYATKESKYRDIFQDYEVVESSVLVFGDDSLVLGRQNKKSIASLASRFDPQTDVMSVIGCSHGSSNIENGNAYLANNRAVRVKNEFVTAGLEHGQVLEEGCWNGKHFPEMPARGVLVQHRRLRG